MPKNGTNVMNHPYSRAENLSIWRKSWLLYVTLRQNWHMMCDGTE